VSAKPTILPIPDKRDRRGGNLNNPSAAAAFVLYNLLVKVVLPEKTRP
jgi:hypothetical protein